MTKESVKRTEDSSLRFAELHRWVDASLVTILIMGGLPTVYLTLAYFMKEFDISVGFELFLTATFVITIAVTLGISSTVRRIWPRD